MNCEFHIEVQLILPPGSIPVLQQLEDLSDGAVSVNDCLRPVSRYFDRISEALQP